MKRFTLAQDVNKNPRTVMESSNYNVLEGENTFFHICMDVFHEENLNT